MQRRQGLTGPALGNAVQHRVVREALEPLGSAELEVFRDTPGANPQAIDLRLA
jgi:hypothetical protein